MNYRIDWDNYTSTWWAVSRQFPMIHARHKTWDDCVGLLQARVEQYNALLWAVHANTPGGYKVDIYTIDQITVDLGPTMVYSRLNECDLDQQPRAALIDLLKAVDSKVQHRSCYDFQWYWSWCMLAQYLDPMCLLKFPFPDWELIENTEATEAKREDIGL